jgi:cyclohexyl-isocyanide hydratase
MSRPFVIVFPLFPGLTHLDFTGPHQFLCRLPNAEVIIASEQGGELAAGDGGMVFARTVRLTEVQRCDLLCVPGGFTVTEAALRDSYMSQIKRLAATSRYITSVCSGSLILGAAGLLRGKRAACHWQWRHYLAEFGAIADAGRVVRDGNVITGGGVTAGIDFALTVAAEVAGPLFAQVLQLSLEYAPAPPFNSGSPEQAPAEVLAAVQARSGARVAQRAGEVREAAERLNAELALSA